MIVLRRVDVDAKQFVKAVKENRARILGLSVLLSATMPEMKNVIEALKREGIRSSVKVIIGGAPVTSKYAEEIGADAYGKTAIEGVRICKGWTTS